MICLLIFLLLRKKIAEYILTVYNQLKNKNRRFWLNLFITLIMASLPGCSNAQSKILNYKVVQNNDTIGWMKLEKKDSVNAYCILLNSEIKKRLVFMLNIFETQQAFFENGVMKRSYVYRKINDNTKVNKLTIYRNDHYEINKDKSSAQVKFNKIAYNQLSLYFFEPMNISEVYSDNYEQYLKIKKNGKNCYLIEFPDGNKNYYNYINGVCSRVRIEHGFFTVEFILSQ